MKKNRAIMQIGFVHFLTFRARNVVWFLLDIFVVFVMPSVWLATQNLSTLAYTRADIITYFVGVAIIQSLVTAHFETHMRRDIKDGTFSIFLTKPTNYFLFRVWNELGWRAGYTAFILAPIIGGVLLVWRADITSPHSAGHLFLTGCALVLVLCLFKIMNYIVGLVALFITEAEVVADFFWLAVATFSGALAPLAFFPEWFVSISSMLPFRYLVDFPLSLYLGKLSSGEIFAGFGMLCAWTMGLLIIAYGMFRAGVKKYDGVGI